MDLVIQNARIDHKQYLKFKICSLAMLNHARDLKYNAK